MKGIIVVSLLTLASAAMAQKAPAPEKTQAAIEKLAGVAAAARNAAGSALPDAQAKGRNIFDGMDAAVLQTLPAASASQDEGIVFPDDPPKQDEGGGQDPESPPDQVARIIAEALKKKVVTDEIDRIRQEQIGKVLTKEVKIGLGVAGAGGVTAGVGLLIGSSAVTGVGLAVVGAVLLFGALLALFGGKKKEAKKG